jgi:hypothetical protein
MTIEVNDPDAYPYPSIRQDAYPLTEPIKVDKIII